MNRYNKSELEQLVFIDNKSYEEIGKVYGVTGAAIKKTCKRLGLSLPIRAKFDKNFKPHNAGTAKKINCETCGKEVIISHDEQKYCSKECSGKGKTENTYKYYLSHQDEYSNVIRDMKFVKQHILLEQNNCCDLCSNIDIWNNKKITLILDHIDGNAANNVRKNLRLICPNCDSQLDTYKSKNKNSARKQRYLKNYKN